jgi:DnaJ-class molecular chaperone
MSKKECNICKGKGYVTCKLCDGDGIIVNQNCELYSQGVGIKCYRLNEICKRCNGKGVGIQCPKCRGCKDCPKFLLYKSKSRKIKSRKSKTRKLERFRKTKKGI